MKNEMPYSAWAIMRDKYGYEEALELYYQKSLEDNGDIKVAFKDLIRAKRMINMIMTELADKEEW